MGMGAKVAHWAAGHVAVLLIMAGLSTAGAAQAAPPSFLLQIPETQTSPGQGAGELNHPRGVDVDDEDGRVYVADLNNARMSEFTAWGLFVRSWGWGVADGSEGPQICGPPEPEGDPDPSLCRAGTPGSGRGQLNLPLGVTVDPAGAVYVFELGNLRVQKFGPAGEFLLMFGGDVNQTKTEAGAPAAQRNVCPVDPGDVCKGGVSGEGPSQLSGTIGDFIDYSPAENAILVGDKNGIQVFNLDGSYKKEIPFEGDLAPFAAKSVNALDVQTNGDIYFSLSGNADVFKISMGGAPLSPGKPGESKFKVGNPLGVAVDVEGNVFVIDDPPGLLPELEPRVFIFDAAGNRVVPTPDEEAAEEFFPYVPSRGPSLNGLATNLCGGSESPGNLYVSFFTEIFSPARSYLESYGTPPIGCEDPPERDPEIVAQFAVSVERERATVKAQVNPLFWPDTTYYVEYGTGKCSEGGCPLKAPASAQLLTSKSINAALATAGVVLEGLTPATMYHYRFVAESGGGGPVFGIDPDGRDGPSKPTAEIGLEGVFKTPRPPSQSGNCTNHSVRAGASSRLPDCRAYEMVSALSKGNGDVALWSGRSGSPPRYFEMDISASSGDSFTYTSAFAFADPNSAPFVSQYLAKRSSVGWGTESLSPSRTESPLPATNALDNEFQGFDEDLCQGWIRNYSVAPLDPDGVEKYPNLYRRTICSQAPTYEAVTTNSPPHRLAKDYFELSVKGFSADGSHTIFAVDDALHPDAPISEPRELLLYEHVGEETRFVCYLPDGTPVGDACSAGSLAGSSGTDLSNLHNAISRDGSRIFWTASSGPRPGRLSHPGQIYVRVGGVETRQVSTTVAAAPAWYWTAAADGSRVIFAFDSGPHKEELYELDVDTGIPALIAREVDGPMGASEDASRIYFASREDLDGTGPASPGSHNLYLYQSDSGGGEHYRFIMRLAEGDIGPTGANTANSPTWPIDLWPSTRGARISANGLHAAFMSVVTPSPTGYDNLDAISDRPNAEVYVYDAVEEELRCVSCNPTGARPVGGGVGLISAASNIQAWEFAFHAPRVLSDDGTRVFFESFEALVPRDTNSNWDVYQWEEESKGTCKATSETFSEDSGGCVDLISSGTSTAKSTFLDADPSGDNIFFSTQSSLVKADYGLNDVYVARVGGGFPEPQPQAECEGEACQSPPPPPPEVTPSTELSQGDGNVAPTKARPCPKGKRRVKRAGKVKCVKRKAAHRRRAAR